MEDERKSDDEILQEIIYFIARFFLVEKGEPTLEEEMMAKNLSKLTLRYMSQLMDFGMRQNKTPIFGLNVYVKDLGAGVGEVDYSVGTIGGELFEILNLGDLARKLENSLKDWNNDNFGTELSEAGANFIQQWSGVLKKNES